MACMKPVELGYAQELWTIRKPHNHIQEDSAKAGYLNLRGIAFSTINAILNEKVLNHIKSATILRNETLDSKKKMDEVLIVYKQLGIQLESGKRLNEITLSYDEK